MGSDIRLMYIVAQPPSEPTSLPSFQYVDVIMLWAVAIVSFFAGQFGIFDSKVSWHPGGKYICWVVEGVCLPLCKHVCHVSALGSNVSRYFTVRPHCCAATRGLPERRGLKPGFLESVCVCVCVRVCVCVCVCVCV